jgi:hypothetical protein
MKQVLKEIISISEVINPFACLVEMYHDLAEHNRKAKLTFSYKPGEIKLLYLSSTKINNILDVIAD